MVDPYDRFELMLNDEVVKTPVALASMAGIVDAGYVLERAEYVGAAFLGGWSIDAKTIAASHLMAQAGREEFFADDPLAEIARQAAEVKAAGIVCGVNLRGSSPGAYQEAAEALGPRVICEVDAHCRQEPMINAGCGEYLLRHPQELMDVVGGLKSAGVTVSVKIRAGVAGNDSVLARDLWKAGADILHIDLMDFGHAKLRQIRNSCPLVLIANNSINSFDRAKDMFSHGADLVSLARKADKRTLLSISDSIATYADTEGWYNAPKQLCRGGDLRALTFCCMPVKDCPLLPALRRIDLSPGEYIGLKQRSVIGTPLVEGENTCFGSLAWCCKSSTPCMFRDITLAQIGITRQDYMRYKHRLSEKIMAAIFHDGADTEQD
jgi:tRNA-dihydrouridine synthase B